MRNKLNIYIYIFLIVFGFNLFPIVKVNAFIENDKNEIGVDYLKNLPSDDYIIGPGDELNVIVSRDYPELTTEAIVDGEGTIYLPKLNRIYVKGLTIGELNNTLNLALKEFIKYPSVEVLIKTYRPIRVLMKGEVESPGLQTLEGSSSLKKLKTDSESEFNNSFYFPTVFDAIRKSGGVTEFANLSNIKVIRKVNMIVIWK